MVLGEVKSKIVPMETYGDVQDGVVVVEGKNVTKALDKRRMRSW